MARRGFFGRIADFVQHPIREIQRILETPPEREEQPPEERQRGAPTGRGRAQRRYWDSEVPRPTIRRIQEETGYSRNELFMAHQELFYSLPGMVDEPLEERHRLWELYVREMVIGHGRRNDRNNLFWQDIGIDPRDFDWQAWRDVMGYSKRK